MMTFDQIKKYKVQKITVQNYEHKSRHESEHLFRMEKVIVTNYQFSKAGK